MKKIIIFLLGMLMAVCADAQIAKWIIRPNYDYVHLVYGTNIYKGGLNDSTFIWNANGETLLATPYFVGPFKDDIAIVAEGNVLKGLVTTKGKYVSLAEGKESYEIDTKHPVFEDGLIRVKKLKHFYFLDKNGKEVLGPYAEATHFHNGITSISSFSNIAKEKEPFKDLVRVDNSKVKIVINNKTVKSEDIVFVSVPNDQNKSLLIIKKEVYILDSKNNIATRLSTDRSTNKKTFVSIKTELMIVNNGDGSTVIPLDKGRAYLDENGLLSKIEMVGGVPLIYEKKKDVAKENETELIVSCSEDGIAYGVDWMKSNFETIQILPPQFSDVSDLINSNAVVCLKDRYGVVQLDKLSSFQLTLNDGNDIGFKHGKYASSIQASLPSFISYDNVMIIANKNDGCEINPVSRTGADTREGNYLKYNCNLRFPEGIDENRSERIYNFTLDYEGLQSPLIPVKTKVWYVQQYDVNIEGYGIDDDGVWIQVNVSRKTDVDTDNNYWFNVELTSNLPMEKTYKKINENIYMFKLHDLMDGSYNIWVNVNEDNCPPVKFPYVLKYSLLAKKLEDKVVIEKM